MAFGDFIPERKKKKSIDFVEMQKIYGTVKVQGTVRANDEVQLSAFDSDAARRDEPIGRAQIRRLEANESQFEYAFSYSGTSAWDGFSFMGATSRPDIYVVAYVARNGGWFKAAQSKVQNDVVGDVRVDLTLNMDMLRVHGTLRWPNGHVASGIAVEAWDADLVDSSVSSDDPIGRDVSDVGGRYSIDYQPRHWDPFPRALTYSLPDIYVVAGSKRSGVADNVKNERGCEIDLRVDGFLIVPLLGERVWLGRLAHRDWTPSDDVALVDSRSERVLATVAPDAWRRHAADDNELCVAAVDSRRNSAYQWIHTIVEQPIDGGDDQLLELRMFAPPPPSSSSSSSSSGDNKCVVSEGQARRRRLPAASEPLGADGFRVHLSSCFWAAGDGGALRAAFDGCYTDKPAALQLLVGDQVYLDAPVRKVQSIGSNELYEWMARRYAESWYGSLGYVMRHAPTLFLADDHEFYNNFPTPPSFLPKLLLPGYRETWTRVADGLFAALQDGASGTGGDVRTFAVGDGAISFCVLDTRRRRDHSVDPPLFASEGALDDVVAWIGALSGPGVLVVSQVLFTAPSGFVSGLVADKSLANYTGQYERLVRALLEAQHSVVVLTGDVHFGNVSRVRCANGHTITQVIASPSSLLPMSGGRADKAMHKLKFPYRELAIDGVEQQRDVESLYSLPNIPSRFGSKRCINNFADITFTADMKMRVRFVPVGPHPRNFDTKHCIVVDLRS
jgi:hypothetical protein